MAKATIKKTITKKTITKTSKKPKEKTVTRCANCGKFVKN